MSKKSANERTFQGELYRISHKIFEDDTDIGFDKILQEQNVGKSTSKFSDGIIYSSSNQQTKIFIELKNSNWDATDDILVQDAAVKAMLNGVKYFVTGTPRQLAIYKTFEEGTELKDRKLKIYKISNAKTDDDILNPLYEKEIYNTLKLFYKDLSNIVHGIKEIAWDSIDKYFVNKLSVYIQEASVAMQMPMYTKINKSSAFKSRLKDYLKNQDLFNVSLRFDSEDIYRICNLSNYLLYLKLIFYSYLQKEVKQLKLKVLEIPEDRKILNKVLRARFDDVLKHDFANIFSETIFDEFEFDDKYIPILKHNIEQISKLNFKQLNADIIGAIYNTLLENDEQHDRGQHFTNTNEVDIINAFCINEQTQFVLDSGCGAGTFLVRAYQFLKYFDEDASHVQLLERVWGIEIGLFPAFLATMNLSLLDIRCFDNYPVIIKEDFVNVESEQYWNLHFENKNNVFEIKNLDGSVCDVKIPKFSACIGNPPYIMQELLDNKEEWSNLAFKEFSIKNINKKSDLYVYFLIHTAAFLQDGGRLGYVISSSWLDVGFGAGLQKFILDNFKIIAIIDHQKKRSFETASINTVILIIEKCADRIKRETNNVRFVKINTDYEYWLGNIEDIDRIEKSLKFADFIESKNESYKNENVEIEVIQQQDLEELSTINGKYQNGNWGAKFFRSSDIYQKIITKAKQHLVPLQTIADVQYGIKTGANDFFYVTDETHKAQAMSPDLYHLTFGVEKEKHIKTWEKHGWYFSEMDGTGKHYMLERFYTAPIFKSQKEAVNLEVDIAKLKQQVIICGDTKDKLAKFKNKILTYINDAEANNIHQRPSCSNRKEWYNLTHTAVVGDFIFPSKIGERFRLIDNRNTQVFCDKVNYVITVNEKYNTHKDLIFALLNSTLIRYFLDLFARQMVIKVSDVDVIVVASTLVIKPELLFKKEKEILKAITSLKNREQETIAIEITKSDRRALDILLFEAIGLSEKDVDELYKEAVKYVQDRKEKSDSLDTTKTKQKLSIEDTIHFIKDRFDDVTSYASLVKNKETITINIPDWKAKYAKEGIGTENLFGHYNVYFSQGNTQKSISFQHPQQVELFQFLNEKIEIKGVKIPIPVSVDDCKNILATIKSDYHANINAIKTLLKTHRSKANAISMYKELLMRTK